jgi:hypothetical protein
MSIHLLFDKIKFKKGIFKKTNGEISNDYTVNITPAGLN